MIVHLITPTATSKIDAEWIDVSTDQGSFVIQEGHAPMLLVMAQDKPLICRLHDETTRKIMVTRGMVEITRAEVRIVFIPKEDT